MTPLRFRAWYPYADEPEMVNDIWMDIQSGTIYADNDAICQRTPTNDIVLMQSTGLRDRNEKEIFERDVLRDRNGVVFEAKWNPEYAAFWIYEVGKVYNGDPPDATTMKIIGNVFEHPSLIPSPPAP